MTQEELNKLILSPLDDDTHHKNSQTAIEENPFKDDGERIIKHSTDEREVDDVTKGLEARAKQVFDQLESISQNSESVKEDIKIIKEHIKNQKKIFEKLSTQFPHIKVLKESLESSNDSLVRITSLEEKTINTSDCILQAIDIMRYQDIYRQKIEKVINITRTLAKYLSSITDIVDKEGVSNDTHIEGDHAGDIISNGEIDELISSLGKKQ